MKPFSLDEYNKNKDIPIVTRDGRPARIVSTKLEGTWNICAVVTESDEIEELIYCNENGRYLPEGITRYDIFFDVDEPKPCTLKPFDKVLTRDWYNDKWRPGLFGKVDPDKDGTPWFMTITNCTWRQCIPYNEETAGLIYTDNPAPSKYVIW